MNILLALLFGVVCLIFFVGMLYVGWLILRHHKRIDKTHALWVWVRRLAQLIALMPFAFATYLLQMLFLNATSTQDTMSCSTGDPGQCAADGVLITLLGLLVFTTTLIAGVAYLFATEPKGEESREALDTHNEKSEKENRT